MAANGFIANRVFDAVAAGALVVSDDVTGIEEAFEGAVRVYRSVEDLRHLCSPAGRDLFPSDEELSAIAARVAKEHSFDQRAGTLLESAVGRLTSRS
jgi:spore maturation protein CgeB